MTNRHILNLPVSANLCFLFPPQRLEVGGLRSTPEICPTSTIDPLILSSTSPHPRVPTLLYFHTRSLLHPLPSHCQPQTLFTMAEHSHDDHAHEHSHAAGGDHGHTHEQYNGPGTRTTLAEIYEETKWQI